MPQVDEIFKVPRQASQVVPLIHFDYEKQMASSKRHLYLQINPITQNLKIQSIASKVFQEINHMIKKSKMYQSQ